MVRLLWVVFITIGVLLPLQSCSESGEDTNVKEAELVSVDDGYVRHPLKIQTHDGREIYFQVEVAKTEESLAKGFMFREHIAPDHGMIFIFPETKPLSFWMRNTLLGLDIIFLDEKGVILNIEEGKPLDETGVSSAGPAKAAIELNLGTAASMGIDPGDQVIFPGL